MTVKTSGDLLAMDVTGEACDLRAVHVTKRYDNFTLDDVTLEVPRGYVVGLIGQNGAGKTTLMRAMLGVIEADAGTIELFGKEEDANIRRAIVVYCCIHHGQREDREMLQRSYDDLKSRLSMSTGYTKWGKSE